MKNSWEGLAKDILRAGNIEMERRTIPRTQRPDNIYFDVRRPAETYDRPSSFNLGTMSKSQLFVLPS
jgi:hypothetical protein